MRITGARKRILTLLAITLLLALLLVYLTEQCEGYLRQQRENAVYNTVLTAANTYGVSPALVLAVIRTEGDFKANALSPAGAVGLMQLLPDTFSYLCEERLKEELDADAIWEPQVNIRYGTYYLAYLFERFGSWQVALAAYNAGEGRVREWLSDPTLSDGKILYDIPYAETRSYVAVTLSAYRDYLEKYNFKE